ncbi:MAG: FdtA/QdtA family cupin domain-containing protein [Verrucomicrobiota bacterium]
MDPKSPRVSYVEFSPFTDSRGQLVSIEENVSVPFPIARIYYLCGTPGGSRRGDHAHKTLRQVAVAVAGSCETTLDEGAGEVTVTLNGRDRGILIEPGVWHTMHTFSEDCVLLVLADQPYEEEDYIRDYDEFLRWIQRA